ncbi:MAG: FtsX-like permease family protein, partial [Cyclobacteriaceae bacterium]|nr:FtsX-like permease family protein [Cyclobacteriaceae bacterium HetDA_MAG_MS6]
YFTMVAILISCLGLYGMVLFVAQSRMKEIGIRKVLGARVVSILGRIFGDFAWLLSIAFVVAIPFSYFLAENWLSEFAVRISIGPVTYISGLLIILGIVVLTIAFNAIKASLTNPVNVLRNE